MPRIEEEGCPRNTPTTRIKMWLALRVSCSFVCLVGNNRRIKRQSKRKEPAPMTTVIKTSISGLFLRPILLLPLLRLASLRFCPRMQAVIPPPGGGYPGANTAEGQDALLSLTTGGYNTAIGFESLRTQHHRSVQHWDRCW